MTNEHYHLCKNERKEPSEKGFVQTPNGSQVVFIQNAEVIVSFTKIKSH